MFSLMSVFFFGSAHDMTTQQNFTQIQKLKAQLQLRYKIIFTPPPNQVSGINLRVTQVDFKGKFNCKICCNAN